MTKIFSKLAHFWPIGRRTHLTEMAFLFCPVFRVGNFFWRMTPVIIGFWKAMSQFPLNCPIWAVWHIPFFKRPSFLGLCLIKWQFILLEQHQLSWILINIALKFKMSRYYAVWQTLCTFKQFFPRLAPFAGGPEICRTNFTSTLSVFVHNLLMASKLHFWL